MTSGRRAALALLVLPLCAAAFARTAPATPIDQLAWLAGCWQRAAGDRIGEEQWMAPRGGTMMGMARTVRGTRTTGWEALRIFERDGALVYGATPSGQAYAEFTSSALTDSLVVFENPAHDFPRRIAYRRMPNDSLHVRVDGPMDGAERAIDFAFERTRCPG